jgi:hypothetical protein
VGTIAEVILDQMALPIAVTNSYNSGDGHLIVPTEMRSVSSCGRHLAPVLGLIGGSPAGRLA